MTHGTKTRIIDQDQRSGMGGALILLNLRSALIVSTEAEVYRDLIHTCTGNMSGDASPHSTISAAQIKPEGAPKWYRVLPNGSRSRYALLRTHFFPDLPSWLRLQTVARPQHKLPDCTERSRLSLASPRLLTRQRPASLCIQARCCQRPLSPCWS